MNGVVEVVEEKHSRKKYQQEQKQGRQATAYVCFHVAAVQGT